MENFIESFDDFKNSKKLDEDSESHDLNQKLKDMGTKAKESRELAEECKKKYEEHIKKGESEEATVELLRYNKYKSKAAMINADIDLLRLERKGKVSLTPDEKNENYDGE